MVAEARSPSAGRPSNYHVLQIERETAGKILRQFMKKKTLIRLCGGAFLLIAAGLIWGARVPAGEALMYALLIGMGMAVTGLLFVA